MARSRGTSPSSKTPSASQRTVATARLRLATAQRWRGDERRAREHLEELVRSLPSDSDVARLAQRYLGRSLDDDPARLLPEDVRFYVELVTPGESARALAALLEGTPFRNPVDYYVASLARRPPGSQDDPEPSPGAVPSEAAYLNEGFLRELELVESAALAVPNADASIGQFLAVLDPGPSNILRGLVQMGLTISRSEILGTVRDTAIFRLPALKDDPPQLAPDNHLHAGVGRDAFLLGRPRAVLEAAAERAGGRGASLADSAEFQKAKALKSGSILFAFLDLQRTVAAVRRDAKEADRPAFDAVIAACGLSRLGGVGWSLRRAVDSDALHLEAHVRVDAAGYELWQALDTEPADAAFLRSVPPCALAYLATRFERAPDRMSALFRAAQPLIELAETTRNEDALRALHAVRHAVEAGPGRVFLEEVRSFAAGIGPELSTVGAATTFLSVRPSRRGPRRASARGGDRRGFPRGSRKRGEPGVPGREHRRGRPGVCRAMARAAAGVQSPCRAPRQAGDPDALAASPSRSGRRCAPRAGRRSGASLQSGGCPAPSDPREKPGLVGAIAHGPNRLRGD
jgi:hypothetical protein